MRTYVDKKPPGWAEKPKHPVIIVEKAEEVAALRENLFMFSNFWRHKVQPKAERLFRRYPYPSRVDICTVEGEVLTFVNDPWRNPAPELTKSETVTPASDPAPTRAELLSKIEAMQHQLQQLSELVQRLPQ
jgi:hypothetical protein